MAQVSSIFGSRNTGVLTQKKAAQPAKAERRKEQDPHKLLLWIAGGLRAVCDVSRNIAAESTRWRYRQVCSWTRGKSYEVTFAWLPRNSFPTYASRRSRTMPQAILWVDPFLGALSDLWWKPCGGLSFDEIYQAYQWHRHRDLSILDNCS